MMLALLQLAAAAQVTPPPGVAETCPRDQGGDIIVCGSRGGRSKYRLPELTDRYDKKPLKAQANIGGVPATARVNSTIRADGLQDNRIMITFGIPF